MNFPRHDGSRLGYIYGGIQSDGTFFEWPKSNGVCDPNLPADYKYDPRIRPWYAAPLSGPKDVMIVIDKSGSMNNANRMALAIKVGLVHPHSVEITLAHPHRITRNSIIQRQKLLVRVEFFSGATSLLPRPPRPLFGPCLGWIS